MLGILQTSIIYKGTRSHYMGSRIGRLHCSGCTNSTAPFDCYQFGIEHSVFVCMFDVNMTPLQTIMIWLAVHVTVHLDSPEKKKKSQ